MEPNRSSPVNDFQVTCVKSFQALGDYYYYLFIIKCVYCVIRVKYRDQVVSTLGLIPEVVDFISASSQISG